MWPVLLVLGLLTGLVGGCLGLGGSIILIPALNEVLGVRQHLYQAAAMIVNFFVVSTATWRHWQAGVVRPDVVLPAVPMSVISVIAGVCVSELAVFQDEREKYLAAVFGVFMLSMALYQLTNSRAGQASDGHGPRSRWVVALVAGGPTGFVAGLLGVGGGVVAIPMQQIFLRLPLRVAIGNSAAIVCGLSLVGAAYKNYCWWTAHAAALPWAPVTIAIMVLPGCIVGGLIGGRLTHVLPLAWVRGAFVAVLVIGGLRQISHAW